MPRVQMSDRRCNFSRSSHPKAGGLQILSHSCPYDWKRSGEKVESMVSVGPSAETVGSDFSGGYLGG